MWLHARKRKRTLPQENTMVRRIPFFVMPLVASDIYFIRDQEHLLRVVIDLIRPYIPNPI